VDLRRLNYFVVLAEELHFRRAAERLHIAQPGLSQQIKVLEREVGATLLERSTGGVTLTQAGQVLLDEGTSLLQEVNRVTERVRAAAAGRTGLLRIVHSRSLAEGLPDELVRTFKHNHPDAEIAVESAWTSRNVAMLRSGEADAAFLRLPLVGSDDLQVLALGATELVVALPASHPLTARRTLHFADLRGAEILSWPREQAPGYYDQIQLTVWGDEPPTPVATEPDPEHLLAAVAQGVGLCIMDSQRAHKLRPRGVVLRRFTRPALTGDFGVAWNPNRRSPLLDAFEAHCRAHMAQVP
jgi:DNA-binding transcriptional LysR family regulator